MHYVERLHQAATIAQGALPMAGEAGDAHDEASAPACGAHGHTEQ
jgi:hypothetical protein